MQPIQAESAPSILNTFNYEKFQSQLYQKINREMANDLCHSVKLSVIKALQQNEPGVLGDTGLENQWEEICVIVDDGDSDLYQDCIDTIDEMISISLEEMNLTSWQKTAIWLCTSNGIDWLFDENDKVLGEISPCWDDSDIVRRIRDEYVCPAALDFINERLEAYSESRYAMDEDYETDEDLEEPNEELDERLLVSKLTKELHPKPDRSDQTPNFVKTEENEALDIGWNEGFLSDGRPYRVECWAESQITMLTFFFSTGGMENLSDATFQKLLTSEGLVQFISDKPHIAAMPTTDASGNSMWSVNVVIGTEDELVAKDSVNLREYEKKKLIKPFPSMSDQLL